MKISSIVNFLPFFTLASCQMYNMAIPDGSYYTQANTMALLTNPASYNQESNEISSQPRQQPNFNIAVSKNLSPHVEILQLVETFLRFKGELASKLNALAMDNWDLIRSVYFTLVSKLGTLHTFTLTGIQILRQILSIAANLMAQWSISLPPVNLGVSVGANQGNNNNNGVNSNNFAFSINKNGNLWRRR